MGGASHAGGLPSARFRAVFPLACPNDAKKSLMLSDLNYETPCYNDNDLDLVDIGFQRGL